MPKRDFHFHQVYYLGTADKTLVLLPEKCEISGSCVSPFSFRVFCVSVVKKMRKNMLRTVDNSPWGCYAEVEFIS
jgi:hypothetical protein